MCAEAHSPLPSVFPLNKIFANLFDFLIFLSICCSCFLFKFPTIILHPSHSVWSTALVQYFPYPDVQSSLYFIRSMSFDPRHLLGSFMDYEEFPLGKLRRRIKITRARLSNKTSILCKHVFFWRSRRMLVIILGVGCAFQKLQNNPSRSIRMWCMWSIFPHF